MRAKPSPGHTGTGHALNACGERALAALDLNHAVGQHHVGLFAQVADEAAIGHKELVNAGKRIHKAFGGSAGENQRFQARAGGEHRFVNGGHALGQHDQLFVRAVVGGEHAVRDHEFIHGHGAQGFIAQRHHEGEDGFLCLQHLARAVFPARKHLALGNHGGDGHFGSGSDLRRGLSIGGLGVFKGEGIGLLAQHALAVFVHVEGVGGVVGLEVSQVVGGHRAVFAPEEGHYAAKRGNVRLDIRSAGKLALEA